MDDRHEKLLNLHLINGKLNYNIDVFGDYLARKEGYKKHYGLDAIYFYLVEKYKWTPAVVKALSFDDLRFLLEEEMAGWTLPPDAR